MKYMSVITNFGCHYKCPYCIVKENNLHIPKTTVAGLDNLREALKVNGCNIISISGGGDPLHEYDKHIEWYRKFFGITKSHRVYFDDREQSIPVACVHFYRNRTFTVIEKYPVILDDTEKFTIPFNVLIVFVKWVTSTR